MPNVCSVEEAVGLLRTVDQVGFGLGPAIPDALLTGLGGREDWEDLQLGGALCLNLYDVFTKPGVSYRCGFFGTGGASAALSGPSDRARAGGLPPDGTDHGQVRARG